MNDDFYSIIKYFFIFYENKVAKKIIMLLPKNEVIFTFKSHFILIYNLKNAI